MLFPPLSSDGGKQADPATKRKIELPPLSLRDDAEDLRLWRELRGRDSMRHWMPARPEKPKVVSNMPVVRSKNDVDPRMPIITPEGSIDYKMTIEVPPVESATPPEDGTGSPK